MGGVGFFGIHAPHSLLRTREMLEASYLDDSSRVCYARGVRIFSDEKG